MTEAENIMYEELMQCIENKSNGNSDEFDIQRKLGILYHYWKMNGENYVRKD